jgi:lipopolysaccharide assembly outer membrane protein LptD (OstA)
VPWRWKQAFGSVRGGFRETAYNLNDTSVPMQVNVNPADPGSKPPSILPTLDDEATREIFYMRGEAGTSLARVYPFERFGISKLKHTIEPTLEYLYVPRTDTRQAALPLFDDVDRINQRSVVTYGVTSRLLARMKPDAAASAKAAAKKDKHDKKEHDDESTAPTSVSASASRPGVELDRDGSLANGAAYDEMSFGPQLPPGPSSSSPRQGAIRELGRFALFQSYDFLHKGGDFIDEVDAGTGEVLRDEGDRASDVAAFLRLTPVDFLSFEGRTDFGVTSARPKGAAVGLSLADPRSTRDDFSLAALRGRTRFSVGYRYVRNAIEEVNGSVLLRLTKRFYAAYEARYDNLSKRFLENRYGFRVISGCECWVVDVGISDKINPNETEVRVLVSLVGLGQFGKEPFRQSLAAVTPSLGFLGQ